MTRAQEDLLTLLWARAHHSRDLEAIENWFRVIVAADMAGRGADCAEWDFVESLARERLKAV